MGRPAVNPVATRQPPHAITSALDAAGIAREDKGGRLLERPAPRARAVSALRARHHLPEQCASRKRPLTLSSDAPHRGQAFDMNSALTYLYVYSRKLVRSIAPPRYGMQNCTLISNTCVSVETLPRAGGLIPRESAGPRVDSSRVHSLPGEPRRARGPAGSSLLAELRI